MKGSIRNKSNNIRRKKKYLLYYIIILSFICPIKLMAQEKKSLEVGSGNYKYFDEKSNKIINIYYYKPISYTSNSRIIIAMHGENRNDASKIRDEWIEYSNRLNCIILVPEFSKIDYPYATYCLGNIADLLKNDKDIINMNKEEDWIYTIIENLFLSFVEVEHNLNRQYILVCRSSSAMSLMFVPFFFKDTHIQIAFSVNSGSYYFNDQNVQWPVGNKGVIGLEEKAYCNRAFSFPLVFVLGEQDIQSMYENKYLPANLLLTLGKTNYERGRNAYEKYKEIARKENEKYIWELLIVPNAGHFDVNLTKKVVEYIENGK